MNRARQLRKDRRHLRSRSKLPCSAGLRLLLTLALATGLAACSASPTRPVDASGAGPAPVARVPRLGPCPGVGGRAALPDVQLSCLTGNTRVRLSRIVHDRPVLINLWASWCVPCQTEMPALQRSFETYSRQLDFLGVNSSDERNSARDFLAAFNVHFPQVFDSRAEALHRIGGSGLPLTIVLARDGRQLYMHRGQLRPPDLRKALVAAGVSSPDVARLLDPARRM